MAIGTKRGGSTAAPLVALEEERDLALSAVRTLDEDFAAGRLEQEEFRQLRVEAVSRAASAIRALEGARAQPQGGRPRPIRPRRRRRDLALVGGILCLVAALGIVVGAFATARLPGQTISGSVKTTPTQQLAQELVQGRILVAEGRDAEALRVFGDILAKSPGQPEALAYRGWLYVLAGEARHNPALLARGRSDISAAVRRAPSYPDAHLFLGIVLYRDVHDTHDALIQMQLFLADHPSNALVANAAPQVNAVFVAAGEKGPVTVAKP